VAVVSQFVGYLFMGGIEFPKQSACAWIAMKLKQLFEKQQTSDYH
jgi:hypothetical protein